MSLKEIYVILGLQKGSNKNVYRIGLTYELQKDNRLEKICMPTEYGEIGNRSKDLSKNKRKEMLTTSSRTLAQKRLQMV